MKRQYSFNEISQIPMNQLDYQTKPIPQPYYTGTKQNKQSWTDIRVEQIKRKYQTPSHRKITSNHVLPDKYRQYPLESQSNPFASYRNALRDSLASPNLIKRQYRPPSNQTTELIRQDNHPKSSTNKQNTEIKQYSNHLDKSSNIKNLTKYDIKSTNKYINKYKQIQCIQHNKIDPRVENIDKINIKIKNILDCLHQNQFHHQMKQNKQQQQFTNTYLQKSINQKNTRTDHLHDTKILSRQKFIPEEHLTTPPMKSSIPINQQYLDKHSLTPQSKQINISKYRLQDKYINIKNSQQSQAQTAKTNNKQEQESWFEQNKAKISRNRSKSCLNSKKQQIVSSQQQYHKTHKKFDDQIIKINTRIKQFQQEKKKLNIQFIPYHYQMKSNKSTTHLNQNFTHRCNTTQQQYQTMISNHIQPHQKNQFIHTYQKKYNAIHKNYDDQSRKKTIVDNKKPLNPQYQLPLLNKQLSKQQPRPIPKLLQSISQKQSTPQFEQRIYKLEYQTSTQKQIVNKCQTEIKEKTQSGIEQRKKKLMSQTIATSLTQEEKIFIDHLLEQVKLDQKLRNAKIWYRDLTNADKEQILSKVAGKLGVRLDIIQLLVTEQQDNPFYSIHENEQSYQTLIQYWQNSQRYWSQNIKNIPDINRQRIQKLATQKIDLQKKGYCTIEDLVRFLNLETGTFYRNRDLILIFRRISKKNKIQPQEFVSNLYL